MDDPTAISTALDYPVGTQVSYLNATMTIASVNDDGVFTCQYRWNSGPDVCTCTIPWQLMATLKVVK